MSSLNMYPEACRTLQRHSTENSKHVHVSVSDLCIPLIGLPILLQENRWAERGMWKLGLRHRAIPFLGIHKFKLRSVERGWGVGRSNSSTTHDHHQTISQRICVLWIVHLMTTLPLFSVIYFVYQRDTEPGFFKRLWSPGIDSKE